MTTQPKALRLADALMDYYKCDDQDIDEAAAELRRLHAENERLHQINCSHEVKLSVRGYEIQIADLEAQRDALLKVLKYLDKEFRQHGRQHWPEAVRVAAAIKAVEDAK